MKYIYPNGTAVKAIFPAVFLFLLITSNLSAQLFINEFSGANYDDFADNFGNEEDWIEIYNAGVSPVDLSGYHLSDRMTNPTKWAFPAGTSINAGGFLRVWCSKRDVVVGNSIHTNFKITQTRPNEAVVLADPAGVILDSNEILEPNQKNHSWGRDTDGAPTWSVFLNPTPGNSNTNPSAPYAGKPTILPDAGFYANVVQVSITAPDVNSIIYFTTDGSVPTASDILYTVPFNITQTSVVKAIAISQDPNVPDSFLDYSTFFINEDHSVPVVSISGDDIMNLMNGNSGLRPQGTFELFKNNIRVADATGEFNKHGNDSWAYPQRGIDYITRDQFGDDWAVKHDIFDPEITDRDRFQRVILKAAANDNYPFETGGAHIRDAYVHTLSQLADMDVDERTNEPCIVYSNGDYWGVYEIREKVDDHDFTDYYYGHDQFNIDFIKTWGNTWQEYGDGLPDWNTLHNFITTNDMSIQANYDQASAELNMNSLIDYIILNTHVVTMDWLNWNTGWWRGEDPTGDQHVAKWRYILWDNDATFDHYINYTGVPDTSPNADPCDNESPQIDDPEGHLELLTSLFANDDFYALYINRYADMNNTFFTCDFMIGLLDSMLSRIEPEMQRHMDRWGGNMSTWQNNIADLESFILTRCTVINGGIEGCYEVEGPYPLVIIVDPPLTGDVQVNTIVPGAYPFQSNYFSGVPITLSALPATGQVFDFWEPLNATLNPGINNPTVTFDHAVADTIIAHFLPDDSCPNLTLQPSSTNSTCTASDGTATVVPTSGTGPFTYFWDANTGNQNTQTAVGLAAGTYLVSVSDFDSCEEQISVTVNASAGNLSGQTTTSPASCIAADGSASITANGGTAPFTYLWDANAGSQTSSSASGLTSGVYNATIVDSNGCETTVSATVDNVGSLNSSVSSTPAVCTSNNGSASINVSGGTSPYTYIWDANSGGQTTQSAVNLTGGTYNATVTDVNGCSSFISVTVNTDNPLLSLQWSANETSCAGNDGTATVTSLNGTQPFTYQWGPDAGNQTTQTAVGLEPGEYGVIVTDANGCQNAIPATVLAGGNLIVSSNSTNASCNGVADGTASVSFSQSYTYSWSNGSTEDTATGLSAGNYTVTVVYGLCETTASATVNEPDAISVNISAFESQCSANGSSATAIVAGGQPPHTYEWNTGDMMPAIGGLATGTYTVTVTDANGCKQISSLFIESNEDGPVLSTTQDNVSCAGANDGSIDLTVANGTAPFTYSWNGLNQEDISGLTPGAYTVIVNDASGCIAVTTVIITEPTAMTLSLSSTSSDGDDGTASVVVFGGVPPFTYQWSNGQNSQVATGLAPGEYTVFVTDGNGCTTEGTVTVGMFTGVTDLESLTMFEVYPNPTSGRFTVELGFNRIEEVEMRVVNMLGQVLKYETLQSSSIIKEIDISNQAAGMYAIQVVTSDGLAVREVIKIEYR